MTASTLLLDTHALLWWLLDPDRIPEPLRVELETAPLAVCSVSAYELGLKAQLGKLPEAVPILPVLEATLRSQDIATVAPDLGDQLAAGSLPLHHRDPFDRMIVAVALRRGWNVVTADPALATYGVVTRWN